ncbi:MAG TPA: ATP-binding domain-containing protein, partial [Streptosporangiaceae bacterium]|nr:ATP-binding domain-containing protein [Streptosporangiaceae bacterium]
RVIRAALQGVLVVQGGPGTGKTVAALHRAAYLLYTHRRTLERRGVLVIGPNATFLRYISQVLPSLGETDVVLSSMAELFPGVTAAPDDDPAAAQIKGDVKMVNVLRRAVRDRQQVPRGDLEITADGVPMTVPGETVLRARDRARGQRRPHNVARKLFVTEMLGALAAAEAAALGRPLDPDDLPYTRARLWDEAPVRAALDDLWPFLTPQRLVAGLLAEEGALRRAAPDLSSAERSVVLRPGAPDAWTVADVPLLDEAAQLLGNDDSAAKRQRRAAERERRAEERYAQEVLEITGVAESGFVDASTLADWNRDPGQQLTTAERAWADPSWVYGHVIVDEAQELSAMAWRMVMRRIPTRSMTVVGDVAQRGSAAGARSWAQMLDPYVKGRWHEEFLTVNYRTPAEIMGVAADVLASVAPGEQAPESVREEGVPPRAVRGLDRVASVVGAEHDELVAESGAGNGPGNGHSGRLAVIAPTARIGDLARTLPAAVPGDLPEVLDAPVALLTVGQSKGLEFDRVVLVDPAGILAQSPAGGHDLYVALTRATHRLTVVYDGELPAVLGRLERLAGHEAEHHRVPHLATVWPTLWPTGQIRRRVDRLSCHGGDRVGAGARRPRGAARGAAGPGRPPPYGQPAGGAGRWPADRADHRGRRHARRHLGGHGPRAGRTRTGPGLRRRLRRLGRRDHRGLAAEPAGGPARLGRTRLRQDPDPSHRVAARPAGGRRPRADRGPVPDHVPDGLRRRAGQPGRVPPAGHRRGHRPVHRPAPAHRQPGRAAPGPAGQRRPAPAGRAARRIRRPPLLRCRRLGVHPLPHRPNPGRHPPPDPPLPPPPAPR